MTTLITADIHLSENLRDGYRLAWFNQLPALTQELGAARVLVLGDLTEAKAGHGPAFVNAVVDGFAALAEVADVYVLKGNHDYTAEDVPFFRHLRHIPRVRWINDPAVIKLRGLGRCLFLPYARDISAWADWLVGGDVYDWIFCHQTFGGADMDHGHRADGAQDPRATFGSSARVISGDVHVPQQLGPVTYVGAPYKVDFGDTFEGRVLLIDGDEVRSVPTTGPQKRLIKLSGRRPLDGLRMQHPLNGTQPLVPGDVVKVVVELPAGSETSRAAARSEVRAWAQDVGVTLYAVQVTSAAGAAQVDQAARRRDRPSDEALVRTYAASMGQEAAVVAAGLKIMEKVA